MRSDRLDRRAFWIPVAIVLWTAIHSGSSYAQQLNVTAVPTAITLPDPGAMDFEFGQVESLGTIEIIVDTKRADAQWYLFVHSQNVDLGGYGKPTSDLLWRVDGDWLPVSASETLVASGTGVQSVFVELAMALSWTDDVPGTYAGDLEFRIHKNNNPQS